MMVRGAPVGPRGRGGEGRGDLAEFALVFLGVGSAGARSLGSSAAVLERRGEPILLIDCGPDTLHAFAAAYCGQAGPPELPDLFVTHPHLDHVAGLEALFYRLATAEAPLRAPRLYVPAPLVSVLQRRLADYPSPLAEGGRNFWDVFHLIPVSEQFWHRDLCFDCFPVRHHEWLSAFGLALPGRFLYTGDTRPIPEVINCLASHGEHIFHDCALHGNPSHTGVDELPDQYKAEQVERMILYHYESEDAAEEMRRRGFRVALPGERIGLPDLGSAPGQTRRPSG
jgi:ribonuclease BN (tRNA processing enzyme)